MVSNFLPDDDELHWRVSVGGVAAIMDSQDLKLWPGCHRSPASCDYSGKNPLHVGFDKLFKVPSTAELSKSEMERLRWQVEGALWTLAGMGGVIPANMFSFPAPVGNFSKASGQPLSPTAIYGAGFLNGEGGQYRLSLDNKAVTETASTLLGVASSIPSGWVPHGAYAAGPDWIQSFWKHALYMNGHVPDTYVVVSAQNDELELLSHESLGRELQEAATAFNGMQCSSAFFQGAPSVASGASGASGAEVGRRIVQEIKTGGSQWVRVCDRPHPGKIPFMSISNPNSSTDPTHIAVGFREMLWTPFKSSDEKLYGYQQELKPVGAPWASGGTWWSAGKSPNSCYSAGAPVDGAGNTFVPAVTEDCVASGVKAQQELGGLVITGRSFGEYILSPEECSKSERVRLFLNGYPPPTACDGASQLVQALGIACELQNLDLAVNISKPPAIESENDIGALGMWVQAAGARASEAAGKLYVERIPASVLAEYASGEVGEGNTAGTMGTTRLELAKSLRAIRDHWRHISETLSQMGRDMKDAELAIQAANLALKEEDIEIAIRKVESWARAAEATAEAVGGFFNLTDDGGLLNPGSAVAGAAVAGIEIARAADVAHKLGKLGDVNKQQNDNSKARVFNELSSTVAERFSTILDSLTALHDAVATAKQSASTLDALNGKAENELAKASGEDFAVVGGQVVQFPVNTVLNRQYDVTKQRYEKALAQARYLAFLARLSIEQRIGEKLDSTSFPTSVGPVESPAEWADDVCSMTGIDFSKYKDAPLPEWAKDTEVDAGDAGDTGANSGTLQIHPTLFQPQFQRNLLGLFKQEGVIDELSKQYIGDYVTRLENFVMYYNTEFPSHEGDDTAVLSFRDDLLRDTTPCVEQSRNLLFYSGALNDNDAVEKDGGTVVRGWRTNSCDEAAGRCLRVVEGRGLDSSSGQYAEPPLAIPNAQVSLLTESPLVEMEAPPEGWPAESEQPPAVDDVVPPRMVYQQVRLEPGAYVASWWDSARTAEGKELEDPGLAPTLRVVVNGPDGLSIMSSLQQAFVNPDGGSSAAALWGERKAFGFEVAQAGLYTVALGITDSPAAAEGHIALAGLQLEKADSAKSSPSAYTENGATRLHVSTVCRDLGAQAVQSSFTYGCEADGRCFYELGSPVIIDTSELEANPLGGKLATGNFNFRHITVAVNLVGTDLLDCSDNPTMSCYANEAVDYTFSHEATNVAVAGWNGTSRSFNFGEAFIHDGKALAGERVITVPIGNEDQTLLQQEGINKGEYMGRPLDGIYRLRIWDQPGLAWNRLEDVQLVLKYRYWSAVRSRPSGP